MSTISLAAMRVSPLASFEDMDSASIAAAFTSVTATGLAFIPREHLLTVSRECNDFGGWLRHGWLDPRRTGDSTTQFPVFHGGIGPLDSKGRGKTSQIDVPVVCAGVRVEPGDLIFGDADGVVAIPRR